MVSNRLFLPLIALFIFVYTGAVFANNTLKFSEIVIVGNERTSTDVLLKELGFTTKQQVSTEQLEQGVQNIRSTQLFSAVSFQLFEKADDSGLVITVVEKWTTIPIVKLSSGGGVNQLALGVYDPNLFGNYIEAGFQYERLGDTNSGVAWFKDPRLFNSRDGLSIQLWKTARLRTKFEQNHDAPIEKTGFLHSRDKLFFGYSHEFLNAFNTEFYYEYNDDSFSDELVSDKIKALIAVNGLPIDTTVHFLGSKVSLGQIVTGSQTKDGSKIDLSYRYGFTSTKGVKDFWEVNLDVQTFVAPTPTDNWAHRFMAGYTGTSVLQYWHYLGGLDRIRGFANDRFAGRYYWLSNLEYRRILVERDAYVVQGVGFLDAATTAETFNALDRVVGASVGFGARLILPKIYRFVIRLDVAAPIKKEDDHYISFGLQQFF